jgi:hypothetical protein
MNLVFQAVTGIATEYTGKTLKIVWTIPYPSAILQVAVQLYDQTANKSVFSGLYDGSQTTVVLQQSLSLTSTYTLTLTGVNANFKGPPATGLPPIVSAPELSSVSYTIASATSATLVGIGKIVSPSPAPTVVMQVYADGEPAQQQVGAGYVATLNLPAPLSSWSAYKVGLFYKNGDSIGPVGNRGNVLLTPPVAQAIAYDGTNVSVTWSNAPGTPAATGAAAAMYDQSSHTKVGGGFADGLSATFQPYGTISATGNYGLTLSPTQGQSQGPEGPTAPVIVAVKAVGSVQYDGARIAVTWLDHRDPNVTGYRLHLLSDSQSLRQVGAGLAGGMLDIALDNAATYKVAVQAVGGIATGPIGTAVTVIANAPTVGNITLSAPNNTAQIAAQVTAPSGMPDGTTYQAYLYEGGSQVAGPVTASGSPLVATFTANAFGKTGFTIRALAKATIQNAQVTGPLGPEAPVLGGAPEIVGASVQTDPSDNTKWQIAVDWILPDAPEGAIATSTATVKQNNVAVGNSGPVAGHSAQFSLAKTSFDATKPVTITVASTGPYGSSPDSGAVNAVLALPALRSAAYDGEEIAASWAWSNANSAAAAVATGYRTLLYDVSVTPPALIYVSEASASLGGGISLGNLALGSLSAVGIGVEVIAGASSFHDGTPTTLILAPPALTSTSIIGSILTLNWTAPTVPSSVTISGYQARFRLAGGGPLTASITGAVTTGTIDLSHVTGLTNVALQPAMLTLAAQASIVTGPESAPLPVLRQSASSLTATVSSGVVAALWAPAPGPVESYKATVTKDGSEVVSVYSPSPEAAITVPSPAASSTYKLRVTPNVGGAAGPESAFLPLVMIAPTVSGAVFDGKSVSVSVTAPSVGDTIVTGYRMVLSANGTPVETQDVATGTSLAMPVTHPLDPTASYQVSAMALAAGVTGPASSGASMIPNAPRIIGLSCTGTNLVMALDPNSIALSGASLQGFLYTDGTAGTATAASNNRVTFTLSGSHAYQVTSQAINSATKGPQSALLDALTTAPALAAATYQNGSLTFAWSGTDSHGTYLVSVLQGNTTVVQSMVTGLSATLAFAADSTRDYTVSVQQVADIVSGPAMTATAIATTGSSITSVAFTDASTAAVQWSTPPSQAANVTGYEVVALADGAEQVLKTVETATLSTSISTATLAPGLGCALAVRAKITSAKGPVGMPVPLVLDVPAGLSTSYDGRNIVAQWEPAADPRVTGYTATISITGVNDIAVPCAGPSLSYAYDITGLAATASITVKVAAGAGASLGPNTAAANVRTGNPAFYVGMFSGAVAPAVYPCLSVPPGSADLVFYLPELFATHLSNTITQGPFSLVPMSPVTAPYAYTVTIAQSSGLWNFSDLSQRQTIAAQFASFLGAIAGTTGATLEAARIVQQTLAAGLPLTFAESLGYRYSFDESLRIVDLMPGMRLKIRSESYQYVNGAGDGIDGYVTGGAVTYQIANLPSGAGLRMTALDPFLDSMAAIQFQAAQVGGAGGVVDLQTAAYRRPFLRMFYPASFPAGQGAGSSDQNHAVALVAASTWPALDTVTQSFVNFGTLPTTPSPDWSINYFRGRAEVVPLIAVALNGESRFVPLGTTLGTLLASDGAVPDLTGVALTGVALNRPISPNLPPAQMAAGMMLGAKRPVMVGYQNYTAFADGSTVLDLPLVQGDEVWTGGLAAGATS